MTMTMTILAGDIGGTNSRMALFSLESGRLRRAQEKTYGSREHTNLDEILGLFLRETGAAVETACFGIAGPVVHGRVNASNLPWTVDAADLSRCLGIANVWLINDLQAHASGIDDLGAEDLAVLNSGETMEANAALIAAGTGLGQAGIYWDGARRHVFATEGGHADFAPRNELEVALHHFLMKKFVHVSCERVLSGPGLRNVYEFLRDCEHEPEPTWLKDELSHAPEPAAVIGHYGLSGKAPICERALEIFAGAYGSEAGNVALRLLATGGVYLSGGIAAKILPKLREAGFLEAFTHKGRMQPLMTRIPIKVIANDRVGLIGAARYAATQHAERTGSGDALVANRR